MQPGSILPFTAVEVDTIKKLYESNHTKFFVSVVLSIGTPIVVSLIPAELMGRRGRNVTGTLFDNFGLFPTVIFIVLFAALGIWLSNKMFMPFKLKKDLAEQKKYLVEVEIKNQQLIPKKIREI